MDSCTVCGVAMHSFSLFRWINAPPPPCVSAEQEPQAVPKVQLVLGHLDAVLLRQLQGLGAHVLEFTSGDAALAALQQQTAQGHTRPCDLVLMDAQMPGLDGFGAAQRMLALPACADIPMVMLSSAGLKGDAQRSRESGFSAYLSKPFTREELLQVLQRVLGVRPAATPQLVTRHAVADQQELEPGTCARQLWRDSKEVVVALKFE